MASVLHQELEDQVLVEQTDFLCEELGDPGRYLPDLRSRGILDYHDYQSIYGKVTNKEKVVELLSLVKGRRSRKGEHSFDVLVNALKRQRVQAHVAVSLEKALIQAKQERETSERKYILSLSVLKSFNSIFLVLIAACSNTTYQHFPSSEHPYRQQSTVSQCMQKKYCSTFKIFYACRRQSTLEPGEVMTQTSHQSLEVRVNPATSPATPGAASALQLPALSAIAVK